jgi:hypothetical protein
LIGRQDPDALVVLVEHVDIAAAVERHGRDPAIVRANLFRNLAA